MKNVRLLAVLVIGVMSVMSAEAQTVRMDEFLKEVTEIQNRYQNAAWSGKHKDAIEPLITLVNMFDTTTVFKGTQIPEGAAKTQKGLYLYDLACCYAVTGQKKLALQSLEQAVDCGCNNDPADDVRLIPVGFVNNNWKCDTTTDPDIFWAKP